MKFNIGDKVHIKGHWNFPSDCNGIVCEPPEFAVQLVASSEPWDGFTRIVQSRKGPIEFYWIKFDVPQIDGDGDGPYPEGEVEAEYISLMK